MSAFIMFRINASDPTLLAEYQTKVPPLVDQYGGKFIIRGGQVITLEGPEENRRLVVMEFPDMESAQTFYHSPEYTQAKKLRESIAEFECVVVQGV